MHLVVKLISSNCYTDDLIMVEIYMILVIQSIKRINSQQMFHTSQFLQGINISNGDIKIL